MTFWEYQIVVEQDGQEQILMRSPFVLSNGDMILDGLRRSGKYEEVYQRVVEVQSPITNHEQTPNTLPKTS